jgi:hypothetical protein
MYGEAEVTVSDASAKEDPKGDGSATKGAF